MNQQLPGLETDVLDLLDQIVGCAAAFAAITEDDDPEDTVQDIPHVLRRLSTLADIVATHLDPDFQPTLMRNTRNKKTPPVPGNPDAIIQSGASTFFMPRTWEARGYQFYKPDDKEQ